MNFIKLAIVLAAVILISEASFINIYDKVKPIPFEKQLHEENPGDALILTPFIKKGNITFARKQALVKLNEYQSIQSYSGYLTVNETCKSNLFFWFFPAENNYRTSPVVLWLQGGPGASSIQTGLFEENGPLVMKNQKPSLRKNSWTLYHHVLYIDNPVGTGYSFTEDSKCYAKNQTDVANDLYEALIQFFQLFPELRTNNFYVTGESYAGKYVPAISYKIHQSNAAAKPNGTINLKGLAIGNGLTDPINQLLYSDYLYQLGFIDMNQRNEIKIIENKIVNLTNEKKIEEAVKLWDDLLNGDFNNGTTIFHNFTGLTNYFNYLSVKSDNDPSVMNYLQRNDVRAAIHVGNRTFNDGKLVEANMKWDLLNSVAPWVIELLKHYRVLIYNGQLDIIVAYPLTENYLQKLNISGYEKAPRYIWYVANEIAGYVKHAGNLTEVLVRNAGHMVPSDQPLWTLDLITRFTQDKSVAENSVHHLLQN